MARSPIPLTPRSVDPSVPSGTADPAFAVPERLILADLHSHPRNYRTHPADQITHLMTSLQEHGVYRNIVVARDGTTILAGHGVVAAARKLGWTTLPGIRLPLDPSDPRALKLLAGDNEIGHLGEVDDRALSEVLREIKEDDLTGLLGTGYDEMMLANLLYITRPVGEIADHNEAAQWVGLPQYEPYEEAVKVTVSFRSAEDRTAFAAVLGMRFTEKTKSIWWPPREQDDPSSLRIEE